MKAPLVNMLGLKPAGGLPRVRLASLAMLAFELEHLKHSMCYAGNGSWQAFRDEVKEGTRPTWEDFCRTSGGITETSQRNYLRCHQVILARMLASGYGAAAGIMNTRPSNLTAQEREKLIGLIASEILTERDSYTALKRESKAGRRGDPPDNDPPPKRSPSVTDIVFQEEQIKEMALAAGVPAGEAGGVAMRILVRDYSCTGNPRNLIRYLGSSTGGRTELNFPVK